MKHILMMLLIGVCSMLIAVSQYFVTGVPGRLIFWPLMIVAQVSYLWENRPLIYGKKGSGESKKIK